MIYECALGGIALPAGASWSGVNNVPSDFTLGGNNVPSDFTLGGTGVPGWHTPLVLFGVKRYYRPTRSRQTERCY